MTPQELINIRRRLNMTQEQMAQALGTRRNTIARWERGERAISPVTAMAIEHLLCKPVQYPNTA